MIHRRFALATLCVFVLSLPVLRAADGELEHTKDSLEKVKELVEQKKAILLDVRDLEEWNEGHVAGATSYPVKELMYDLDEKKLREKLPKDKIIYTYCAAGVRSLKAGKIITKYKYDVRPLKPGYEELVKFGFKSEK